MGNIQVKNIPEELHERLQRQARKREVSLNDMVLSMLESEIGRLEIREKVIDKAGVEITHDPYDLTDRIRAQGETPLDKVDGSAHSIPNTNGVPVENVPADLYERLRWQVARLDIDLDSLILGALETAMDHVEYHERMAAKPVREYSISPSKLIALERAQRDAPIDF